MQTSLDRKNSATKTHSNKIKQKTLKSIDILPLTKKYKENNIVLKAPQTTDKLFSEAFLSMIVIRASCKTSKDFN
jgi:hypothetical protein